MADTPLPPAPPSPPSILEPLPFHRDVVEYLKTQEGELWAWFSSTPFLDEYAATTRLELLKSCYRFDGAAHADLYALVDGVRRELGMEAPVTLYQSQHTGGMNAALCYVPGEIHLVLQGPIRTTLSENELRAIVAHELAHFLLWQRDQGELLVADQMLSAMAQNARAEPSHLETARLFGLYLEVQCDRAALAVSADPLVGISALIKVETGLVDASAESYLQQSEEIFGQGALTTEGLTHPEAFIRARALRLWADAGDGGHDEIARMIEGPDDLGRLSLLGQRRLAEVTRRLLLQFLGAPWLRSEALLAHARLFFPELDPAQADGGQGRPLQDDVASMGESARKYLCYVLLDLATVDRALEEAPLAAAFRLAEEMGLGAMFAALAAEELELGKKALTRLKKESARIVADAAAARTPEPER